MRVPFNKPYKTPEELVDLLKQRGLSVNDDAEAAAYIRRIGYYRLSAYLYPLLQSPKETHSFKTGVSFADAVALYRFDRKLRRFLFNEIEKIEVALRSAVANIGTEHLKDAFWMSDTRSFKDPRTFAKTLSVMVNEYGRSSEDFVRHFRERYSDMFPPAWELVELLPLGALKHIYENLADNRLKKRIADSFALKPPVFASWLTTVTLTRNACCHHARVWNKENAITPVVPRKMSGKWLDNTPSPQRIYYNICIIKWFVDIISPNNDMSSHLVGLLNEFPAVDITAMGFPKGWESEPLWQT